VGLRVVEKDGERRLRFRFPDTDKMFLLPEDDLTFAGPATIAVTRIGDPVPCALASETCAEQSDLIACVDALLAIDGTCGATPDSTFGHFTALSPPNDYRGSVKNQLRRARPGR